MKGDEIGLGGGPLEATGLEPSPRAASEKQQNDEGLIASLVRQEWVNRAAADEGRDDALMRSANHVKWAVDFRY